MITPKKRLTDQLKEAILNTEALLLSYQIDLKMLEVARVKLSGNAYKEGEERIKKVESELEKQTEINALLKKKLELAEEL